MTTFDRKNLTALIKRASHRSDDREWIARYAAERYFGLIVCGQYMPEIRQLVSEIATTK